MSKRSAVRLQMLRLLGKLTAPTTSAVRWPPRILVLRPDHIGDLLFLFPALAELRQNLPDASVTLSVGPWVAALAALSPAASAVETVEFPGFTRRPKANLIQPYALALETARRWRGRFDICLVARPDHWWGAMAAALAGIPRRLGWRTPETEPFLTAALPSGRRQHEVVSNLVLVRSLTRSLGIEAPETAPSPEVNPLQLTIPPSSQAAVERWLERNLAGAKTFLCVHPGAGAANKQWPESRYEALLRLLGDQVGLPIVVTGTASEAPLVERTAASSPLALSAAGDFSLVELAGLLARAALVIGSDSGPLHLAVASGTPTVHIYGPADEAKFGPWGSPARHRVLTGPVACRPCGDLTGCAAIDQLACMRAVSVDQVLRAALALLADCARLPA